MTLIGKRLPSQRLDMRAENYPAKDEHSGRYTSSSSSTKVTGTVRKSEYFLYSLTLSSLSLAAIGQNLTESVFIIIEDPHLRSMSGSAVHQLCQVGLNKMASPPCTLLWKSTVWIPSTLTIALACQRFEVCRNQSIMSTDVLITGTLYSTMDGTHFRSPPPSFACMYSSCLGLKIFLCQERQRKQSAAGNLCAHGNIPCISCPWLSQIGRDMTLFCTGSSVYIENCISRVNDSNLAISFCSSEYSLHAQISCRLALHY